MENNIDNRKKANRKYWKTPKGKLMATYNNMDRRVRGIQKTKAHLYEGLSILSRQTFYDWALSSKEYINLYNNWVASGHETKLSPSIDRIDTSKGYTLDNMRWLTHSENSRLGALVRWAK